MKESLFNTIVANSFKEIGFAFKIPDPKGGVGMQLPFDGFAVALGESIYFESKMLHGLKAWNFNSIEDHQFENLNYIKKENPSSICIYTIGVFESRKFFYTFIFSSDLIEELRLTKKSILKKEFQMLIEKNLYLNVRRDSGKYSIDFSKYKSIIVTKDKWEDIINA